MRSPILVGVPERGGWEREELPDAIGDLVRAEDDALLSKLAAQERA
jgi:hypothetical protein